MKYKNQDEIDYHFINGPKFKQSHADCIFIGIFEGKDGYITLRPGSEYIVDCFGLRYGDEPHQYILGPLSGSLLKEVARRGYVIDINRRIK